jgi:hypothetical protein
MQRFFGTFALGLAFVAFTVSPVLAQTSDSAALGTWRLNVAKSTYTPGPPPRSGTRIVEDLGGGLVRVMTQGADAQGNATASQWVYRVDGKDYPQASKNAATITTLAYKTVDPYTMEYTVKSDGKVTGSGTRTGIRARRQTRRPPEQAGRVAPEASVPGTHGTPQVTPE